MSFIRDRPIILDSDLLFACLEVNIFILNAVKSSSGMDEDTRKLVHLPALVALEHAGAHFSPGVENFSEGRSLSTNMVFEVVETDANSPRKRVV